MIPLQRENRWVDASSSSSPSSSADADTTTAADKAEPTLSPEEQLKQKLLQHNKQQRELSTSEFSAPAQAPAIGEKARDQASSSPPEQAEHPEKAEKAGADTEVRAEGNDASTKNPQTLEERAVAALLSADAGQKKRDIDAIPLLMRNRAPGTEEATNEDERFRMDVNQRPEEASLTDYERVPIDQFGAAMLRGMGWKEGEAIGGKFKGLVEPIEYVPRMNRLGLGATRDLELKPDYRHRQKQYIKPGEKRKQVSQVSAKVGADGKARNIKRASEQLYEEEVVRMQRGAYVFITGGAHRGHAGTITRLHNLQADVRLALSGAVITVDEKRVLPVPSAQYRERVVLLRRGGVQAVYEQEERDRRERRKDSGGGGERSRGDRGRERETERRRDGERKRDEGGRKQQRDGDSSDSRRDDSAVSGEEGMLGRFAEPEVQHSSGGREREREEGRGGDRDGGASKKSKKSKKEKKTKKKKKKKKSKHKKKHKAGHHTPKDSRSSSSSSSSDDNSDINSDTEHGDSRGPAQRSSPAGRDAQPPTKRSKHLPSPTAAPRVGVEGAGEGEERVEGEEKEEWRGRKSEGGRVGMLNGCWLC